MIEASGLQVDAVRVDFRQLGLGYDVGGDVLDLGAGYFMNEADVLLFARHNAGDHFTPGNFRVDDGFAAVPPIVDHHNKVLHLRSGGRRSQRRISMPQIRNPSSVKF